MLQSVASPACPAHRKADAHGRHDRSVNDRPDSFARPAVLAIVGVQGPDFYPEHLILLHVTEPTGEAD
jgi:hypothetical protein